MTPGELRDLAPGDLVGADWLGRRCWARVVSLGGQRVYLEAESVPPYLRRLPLRWIRPARLAKVVLRGGAERVLGRFFVRGLSNAVSRALDWIADGLPAYLLVDPDCEDRCLVLPDALVPAARAAGWRLAVVTALVDPRAVPVPAFNPEMN